MQSLWWKSRTKIYTNQYSAWTLRALCVVLCKYVLDLQTNEINMPKLMQFNLIRILLFDICVCACEMPFDGSCVCMWLNIKLSLHVPHVFNHFAAYLRIFIYSFNVKIWHANEMRQQPMAIHCLINDITRFPSHQNDTRIMQMNNLHAHRKSNGKGMILFETHNHDVHSVVDIAMLTY